MLDFIPSIAPPMRDAITPSLDTLIEDAFDWAENQTVKRNRPDLKAEANALVRQLVREEIT